MIKKIAKLYLQRQAKEYKRRIEQHEDEVSKLNLNDEDFKRAKSKQKKLFHMRYCLDVILKEVFDIQDVTFEMDF